MPDEAQVLDGLVWAQLKEPARIARIASGIVRKYSRHNQSTTKTDVQQAVRETMPPHGRGKYIIEGVSKEIERQKPIFLKRSEAHQAWDAYLKHQALIGTRLNDAYAARFGRPTYLREARLNLSYGDDNYWEKSQAHHEAERNRDKGDNCIGLMIYKDIYTVALLSYAHKQPSQHSHYIAVRDRFGGEPVYTELKRACKNMVEAIVDLGGPEVRGAMARGLPVNVDWVARNITITYPNKSVVVEWHSNKSQERDGEED